MDREQKKQAALENQIQHCRITAPVAGRLEYAQASDRDGRPASIAIGATVRWGQLLFWIIPTRRDVD